MEPRLSHATCVEEATTFPIKFKFKFKSRVRSPNPLG